MEKGNSFEVHEAESNNHNEAIHRMGEVANIAHILEADIASDAKKSTFDGDINIETGTRYDRDGFDREGYNRKGLDRDGYDKGGWKHGKDTRFVINKNTGTRYDEEGYTFLGYDENGYDREGFNKKGYNKDGYDKNGFDKYGFDKEGYDESGHDVYGFDRAGVDGKEIFDREKIIHHDSTGFTHKFMLNYRGFDDGHYFVTNRGGFSNYDYNGYDFWGYDKNDRNKLGIDRRGFNEEGIFVKTGATIDDEGYDVRGYNEEGVNRYGIDRRGYGRDGFHYLSGYNREGYDREGYDREGFDNEGFNKEGFNIKGYDREGYKSDGFNSEGYDREGYDKKGYDREGLDKRRFNKDGINADTNSLYDQAGFNKYGLDKDGRDANGNLDKSVELASEFISSGARSIEEFAKKKEYYAADFKKILKDARNKVPDLDEKVMKRLSGNAAKAYTVTISSLKKEVDEQISPQELWSKHPKLSNDDFVELAGRKTYLEFVNNNISNLDLSNSESIHTIAQVFSPHGADYSTMLQNIGKAKKMIQQQKPQDEEGVKELHSQIKKISKVYEYASRFKKLKIDELKTGNIRFSLDKGNTWITITPDMVDKAVKSIKSRNGLVSYNTVFEEVQKQ